MSKATKVWAGFIPTRYPYTYAFDILRSKRPVEPSENSRSSTSAWLTEYCTRRGLDKEAVCTALANAHIEYEMALEAAEKEVAVRIAAIITEEPTDE